MEVSNSMPDANIISITHHAGFSEDELELQQEYVDKLKQKGIPIYVGSHSLSGVEGVLVIISGVSLLLKLLPVL